MAGATEYDVFRMGGCRGWKPQDRALIVVMTDVALDHHAMGGAGYEITRRVNRPIVSFGPLPRLRYSGVQRRLPVLPKSE
ncbi:MAG: hypothetical protein H6R00_777 [Proteobacteria bacterium]|nr:hypothetical protein [Pseudomonadota bacterium]